MSFLPFLILFELGEEGTLWQIFSNSRHNFSANELASATVQSFEALQMMEALSLQQRRNVIGQFYQEIMEKGEPYTGTHFVAMGIPRRTIYRILEVMERTGSTEKVAGSGRPASNRAAVSCEEEEGKGCKQQGSHKTRKLAGSTVSPLHMSPKYSRRRGEVLQASESSEQQSRACVSTEEVLSSNGGKVLQAVITNWAGHWWWVVLSVKTRRFVGST